MTRSRLYGVLRLCPALFVVTGCATIPPEAGELPETAQPVELDRTPYHPQARYQCGPAALATVLEVAGADVSVDRLVEKVYLPGRRGSLAPEMLAATRTAGRIAYVIEPTLAAIHAELAAGRPVLVLQNLGVAAIPRWHYAVVVGIDPARGDVVLRSGTDRRRVTPVRTFMRTWSRSDFWGFVALEPGELPANVDRGRYLDAVAALEAAGETDAARKAWRVATGRWPDSAAASFGLANVLYADGEFEQAERLYREVLADNPALAAVRNNLAMTLAELGRFDEALAEVERGIAQARDAALLDELVRTRQEIESLAIVDADGDGTQQR